MEKSAIQEYCEHLREIEKRLPSWLSDLSKTMSVPASCRITYYNNVFDGFGGRTSLENLKLAWAKMMLKTGWFSQNDFLFFKNEYEAKNITIEYYRSF